MKFSITSLTCILILALSAIVRAQIYESKDADGNPVFSDTSTAAAEKVNLPQENIADGVEVPPEAEAAKASGGPSSFKETTGHGNVVVIPDGRNEQQETELDPDMPHGTREAEKRYEVGDDPTAEEIERRKEVKNEKYVGEEGNTLPVERRGHAR